RRELGLDPDVVVDAKSFHSLNRARPDGSIQRQIVAELVQNVPNKRIVADDQAAGDFTFRGGATLIINRFGKVRFSIVKPIHGEAGSRRLERQREYFAQRAAGFSLAPYVPFDAARDLSLRGIHRGY